MKEQFAARLGEGARLDDVFALRSRELRHPRTGDAYLTMELADRTGAVRAVRFRPDADELAVPAGSVVRVRGTVTGYRGRPQVTVDALCPVSAYDPADLLPSGPRDVGELVREVRGLRSGIANAGMRAVVDQVFGDPGFFGAFIGCPGSQSRHHAYLGGLLEHTVSVATLARFLGESYDRVDGDLLVAGALLHDVGKVDELVYDTAIGFSDAGRLLGHVVLGERRIAAALELLGDSVVSDVGLRLRHVVLSHHGELEWGAPKRPCVLEAVILHHADNLDAKVTGFVDVVAAAGAVEERWTDVTNLFRRPLYVPRALEDDRWAEPVEDEQYPARSA